MHSVTAQKSTIIGASANKARNWMNVAHRKAVPAVQVLYPRWFHHETEKQPVHYSGMGHTSVHRNFATAPVGAPRHNASHIVPKPIFLNYNCLSCCHPPSPRLFASPISYLWIRRNQGLCRVSKTQAQFTARTLSRTNILFTPIISRCLV
ncbi:hypothetical protein BV22DRAFT_101626 [Leucogyrophana mollusca]|uniref:Uncharacterized protein n=1 Tax=Leucogyrophana mollusca TaxID=85980 RepID=A0ACB8BYD6_9AGAM|nr:hypothetical protein BV22DRAFT_101626 [Leucogyrophana mollusca]